MGIIRVLDTSLFVCELVSCIAGFLFYQKLRNTYWKSFPNYLAFIVAAELPGKYFLAHRMYNACKMFYNLFEIPVEFLFFYWVFHMYLKTTRYKRLPVLFVVTYLICWLADNLYLSKMSFWFSFSYTCGNLFLLVLILVYFIGLVTSDAILNYKTNMLFWVSTGLLLFYLGTFPYYGLRNTLIYNYKNLYTTYSYIMYVLNCLMYMMFTLSFVYGRPDIKENQVQKRG